MGRRFKERSMKYTSSLMSMRLALRPQTLMERDQVRPRLSIRGRLLRVTTRWSWSTSPTTSLGTLTRFVILLVMYLDNSICKTCNIVTWCCPYFGCTSTMFTIFMTFVCISIYLHEFLCSNSANYIDFLRESIRWRKRCAWWTVVHQILCLGK